MCIACEEGQALYRWHLLEQLARGHMPPGLTEEDLRAMDLPLPGEVVIVERPNGIFAIKKTQASAASPDMNERGGFVCDSPDDA